MDTVHEMMGAWWSHRPAFAVAMGEILSANGITPTDLAVYEPAFVHPDSPAMHGSNIEELIRHRIPVDQILHCLNTNTSLRFVHAAFWRGYDITTIDPRGRLPMKAFWLADDHLDQIIDIAEKAAAGLTPFTRDEWLSVFPGVYNERVPSTVVASWVSHYLNHFEFVADPILEPLSAAEYAIRNNIKYSTFVASEDHGKTSGEYRFLNQINA